MVRVYRIAPLPGTRALHKKRRHEHWYARAGRPVTQLVVVRTVREPIHSTASDRNVDRSTYNRRKPAENVANESNSATILADMSRKEGARH